MPKEMKKVRKYLILITLYDMKTLPKVYINPTSESPILNRRGRERERG